MTQGSRPGLWYHGWNVVAACVLVQMAALALTINCFSLFVPGWSRDFHVPVSDVALSISFLSVVNMLLPYGVGVATDRYPVRWLFCAAMAVLALAHVLIATAQSVLHLQLVYALLVPIALTGASIPCQALVSRWFVRRVGLAMGINAFGLSLAGIVFPQAVVVLLPLVGWRMIWFGAVAVIGVVVVPVVLLVIRDRPGPEDPFGYMQRQRDVPVPPATPTLTVRDIAGSRNFWAIMSVFACIQLVSMTISVNIAPIIIQRGGEGATAGLFLSAYYGMALACKLGSGWLCDRIGPKLLIVLATTAAGASATLLALPNVGIPFLLIVAILLGASGAIWTLLAAAMLAEFGTASFGRAYGLACSIAPIGSVAPPLVAYVQESTGSYALPLSFLGAITFAALLALLAFYRPKQPDTSMALA